MLDTSLSLSLRFLKAVGLLVLLASVTWSVSSRVGAQFALLVTTAIWISIAASGHVPSELARRCALAHSVEEKGQHGIAALLAVVLVAGVVAGVVGMLLPSQPSIFALLLFIAFTITQALQNVLADVIRLTSGSPKASLFSGWLSSYVSAGAVVVGGAFGEGSLDYVLVSCVASNLVGIALTRKARPPGNLTTGAWRGAVSIVLSAKRNSGLTLMSAVIPAAPIIFGKLGVTASAEYAFAQRLASPTLMPAWAAASAALPRIAVAARTGDVHVMRKILLGNAALGGVAAAGMASVLLLGGSPLLHLIGGNESLGAMPALGWLLCGAIVYASTYAAFQAAYQLGEIRTDLTAVVALMFGVLAISLQFVTSSSSASLLVAVAQSIILVIAVLQMRRVYGLRR